MTSIHELLSAAEKLWPTAGAEEWDRPGLICGSVHEVAKRVLLSVDVTSDVIAEAIEGDFDLVISHHPFLLRAVNELTMDSAKGAVLTRAIKHDVALFAAHTNADIVLNGVSATLANALGLIESAPLVASTNAGEGHGRLGSLNKPVSLLDFARNVAKSLPPTASGVRIAGDPEAIITRVALCAGAGDSFIANALDSDADVYVTSDLRHHPVSEALEEARARGRNFALVDISHWSAESLWLAVAASQLQELFPDVKFVISDLRTDPWDFAVTQ
ncbi:MAG: hypothetical protein RL149_515 [Actinomycetota bacterium]